MNRACPSAVDASAGFCDLHVPDPFAPWYDAGACPETAVSRSVDMVTVGATTWLCALLVSTKENVYRVPADVSAANAKTSMGLELLRDQLPVVGITPLVVESKLDSGRLLFVPVTLPTSPLKVTIGRPAARRTDALQVDKRGTLDCNCTVTVLGAQGQGVL